MYGMGQVGGMPGGMMNQGNMMMQPPPQGGTFNPQQQQMQQLQYQQVLCTLYQVQATVFVLGCFVFLKLFFLTINLALCLFV